MENGGLLQLGNSPSQKQPLVMNIQDQGGVAKTVARAVAQIKEMLPEINQAQREPIPVSELMLGLECGGSDGNSGTTANPALGYCSDMLVAHGGTSVLSETPEIYGGEHLLTRRSISREVGEALLERIRWWIDYTALFGQRIDINPSVGNKKGGLTTIYEKSLGAIAKGGTSALRGVYQYGEAIDKKGFVIMDTPGYDPASVTGLVAGGAHVVCFTTGRGSCFGCKPVPTIKIATNTPMYNRMEDDMDINAGKILDGATLEEVGERRSSKKSSPLRMARKQRARPRGSVTKNSTRGPTDRQPDGKRSMKFVHAADIHLDSPLLGLERYEGAPVELIRGATRRALENLVQFAIRERVDFVVIAGDLYDGNWRDFNTGMFFIREIAKLREAGIRVYLIAGNHDAASTMTRKLRLPANPEGDQLMLAHERSETRLIESLGVAIHGRSFANAAEIKNMVPDYPAPIPHCFNLGMLHTSLNGSEEHDTYAPCTPGELRAKGYDYWALGHIHKRTPLALPDSSPSGPHILYSGNLQGRHIRETGPRGCLLVTVDDRHRTDVTFHSLDVFRWEVCSVSCTEAANVDDVLESYREQLRITLGRNENIPLGLRVILEGPTRAHQELVSHRERVTAEIRTLTSIQTREQAWVEQVKIATTYPRDQQLSFDGDGPLGELVRYLDELPENPQALQQLADELKDLAKKLPAELTQSPDGLGQEPQQWIRDVLADLKPMLLARLKV